MIAVAAFPEVIVTSLLTGMPVAAEGLNVPGHTKIVSSAAAALIAD
jgi:hypothetical protein